jgi:hypothetical protein
VFQHIVDFRGGLDRRKSIVTLPGGALWQADNVLLTRGNELEKRRAFVKLYDLPAGTLGLATNAANAFVFGSAAAPAGMPDGVIYQQLDAGTGPAVAVVEDYTLFEGQLYVSARLTDGSVRHFFNGTMVASWTPPAARAMPDAVATALRALGYHGTIGSPVLTLGNRIYAGYGRVLFGSALGDPTMWTPGDTARPGALFIELSSNWGTDEKILGLEVYQGNLAVFMRDTIQIWRPDPDPKAFQLLQVLPNIGTMAPRSVIAFSDADVFFLADSGLRSLRARDSSSNATTSDIGTPIDPLLRDLQAAKPEPAGKARGQIEPANGRYWLAIDDEIYAFSYFPTAKVSAWTRLLPGFPVDEMEVIGNMMLLRSGNAIYAYEGTGGAYGADYDCTVVLPMLDGDSPATKKQLQGLDAVVRNVWAVELGTDPAQPDTRELVATIHQPTYAMERLAVDGYGSHFGFRLVHRAAGAAGVASIMLHFDKGETT